MIEGPDALFYTLAFLVPGFLLETALSALLPRRKDATELVLLRLLALSCVNYALWSWLIYLMVSTGFFREHPLRSAAAWTLVLFLSPLCLGVIIAKLSEKGIVRRFLQSSGFLPLHPIPTAWDYKFARLRSGEWVAVTLADGSNVIGAFGAGSFASSDSGERDIFLERTFRQNESGSGWVPVENSSGIIIRGEHIVSIEFWTTTGSTPPSNPGDSHE